MQKILISEATDAQLKAFAKDVQQIDKVPTTRDKILAALVESGHTGEYIFVDGDAGDEEEQISQSERPREKITPMPKTGFGLWRDSPMVTLKILPTDRPGGNEPAHPMINGSPALVIQRNMLVSIPYDFYLVLKQAGGTKIVEGAKPGDLIYTDYYEYPMTDVVLPPQREIDAWMKRQEGNELGHAKAVAA